MKEVTIQEIIDGHLEVMISSSTCPPCLRIKDRLRNDDTQFVYTCDESIDDQRTQAQFFTKNVSTRVTSVPSLLKYNPKSGKWDNYGHPDAQQLIEPRMNHLAETLNIDQGVQDWLAFRNNIPEGLFLVLTDKQGVHLYKKDQVDKNSKHIVAIFNASRLTNIVPISK